MKAALAPRLRSSLSSAFPSTSGRPDTTTVALLAKASDAARPIPVRAPVMRTTGVFRGPDPTTKKEKRAGETDRGIDTASRGPRPDRGSAAHSGDAAAELR